ncbi:MAG: hypothetical protein AB7I41_05470 [Candidatus Sericytochromatia bacterium]
MITPTDPTSVSATMKVMKPVLLCLSTVLSTVVWLQALPALAILGEDYLMMRTYFHQPRRYDPVHEPKFKSFAELRKEMRPSHVHFFTNAEGKISKEFWSADGSPWTFEQADKIRNAIMRRSHSNASGNSLGLVWYYSDGARVMYRVIGSRVISIMAVDKDFSAGDLGKMPLWFTPATARPQFPKYVPPTSPAAPASPAPKVNPPAPR